MEQNCLEQILEDVVRVDIVKVDDCDLSVPFQIPLITMNATKTVNGVSVDRIGNPSLTIQYIGDAETTAEVDSAPTIQQKEKQQAAGFIVEHTLKAPISNEFENVRIAVNSLRGKDFHVVFYTAVGERYMCYSLPESCSISIEAQESVISTQTVIVSLLSMSHIIRLT